MAALTKYDLEAAVGIHAGFGPGHLRGEKIAWTDAQFDEITDSVKIGLGMIYEHPYNWSFLKPVVELTLAEDADSVILPDYIAGIEGDVIPLADSTSTYFPLKMHDMGAITAARSACPSATGRPYAAAITPSRGGSQYGGPKRSLQVYPTADQEYTLQVTANIVPAALTNADPYVYGGEQHNNTFRSAVKAAWEVTYNRGQGPAYQEFQNNLALSIANDRKMKPYNHGRNIDRSDDRWVRGSGRIGMEVNGVEVLPLEDYL